MAVLCAENNAIMLNRNNNVQVLVGKWVRKDDVVFYSLLYWFTALGVQHFRKRRTFLLS